MSSSSKLRLSDEFLRALPSDPLQTCGAHPSLDSSGDLAAAAQTADTADPPGPGATQSLRQASDPKAPGLSFWTIQVDRDALNEAETVDGPAGAGPSTAPGDAPAAGGALYTLHRIIGRGGCGEVWEAEQHSLGRVVAVKRVRADRARDEAKSRRDREFRQEARLTAGLDHPNIIPVHDLGVDENGLPLLAMKLVRGKPWDKLLADDFAALSEPDLLAKHLPILIDVAQAVAFAHSRGVVHRDLKPAQAMIGEFGEVLLMDWGLAVVCEEEDDEGPIAGIESSDWGAAKPPSSQVPLPSRATASNPSGTPAFMAPEQTESTALNIGPWTDVFLLGATLYMLLTKTSPHTSRVPVIAMEQAAECQIDSPKVRAPERLVPDDLAELAMKAMAKNPGARVASAKAFLEALQAHLSGASARRESRELARQAGAEISRLEEQAPSLSAGERYALRAKAAEKLDRSLRLWPANPEALRLRAENMAERVRFEIEAGDLNLAEVNIGALRSMESLPPSIDVEGLDASRAAASAHRERTRRHRERFAAATFVLLLGMLMAVGRARQERALSNEAERVAVLQAETLRMEQQVATQRTIAAGKLVDFMLGDIAAELDMRDDADRRLADSVADKVVSSFRSLDISNFPPTGRITLAADLNRAALLLGRMDRLDAALALASDSLALRRETLRSNHPALGDSVAVVGGLLWRKGEFAACEPLMREALAIRLAADPPDEARAAQAWDDMAGLHFARREWDEALGAARRALDLRLRRFGPDSLPHAESLDKLGSILLESGRGEEASDAFRRAFAIRDAKMPPDSPDLAASREGMALLLEEKGEFAEAEALRREALDVWLTLFGPSHRLAFLAKARLAANLERQGRHEEAEAYWTDVLTEQRRRHGDDHPDVAGAMEAVALARLRAGRAHDALPLLLESQAIRRTILGEEPSDEDARKGLANNLYILGDAFIEGKSADKAEIALREGLELRRPFDESMNGTEEADGWRAGCHVLLGLAMEGKRELPEARREWTRAVQLLAPHWQSTDNPRLLANWAEAAIKLGKPEEARAAVERLLELEKDPARRKWRRWAEFWDLCRAGGLPAPDDPAEE